jgi:hypothetical protein
LIRIVTKPKAFRPEQYLLPIKDAFAGYRPDAFEFLVVADVVLPDAITR